jgi:hypothetical protein
METTSYECEAIELREDNYSEPIMELESVLELDGSAEQDGYSTAMPVCPSNC